MLEWKRVLVLLCIYGLIREIHPSEPYVSEFILGPWRNITREQLNREIYPVGTYSYLSLLVGVFLVTDYLKYKPLILVSGICGIATYAILLWTESLLWLQIGQFIFGLYLATEVAYYTYMYAKVDQEYFKKVSSATRASALIGRVVSGISAQLLYSYDVMDFRQLNYITLVAQLLSFTWAIFLPSVRRSIYFHREVKTSMINESNPVPSKQLTGLALLWEHAKSAYTRPSVIAWSLIYAASMAGFLQIQNYMQLLWNLIEPDKKNLQNGLVQAIQTLIGACAALLAGVKMPNNCGSFNIVVLVPVLVAAIQAGATLMVSYASVLWVSYVGYIILGALYHFIVTFTSAEVAKNLFYDSCYGLVFGINTLVALVIQSFLTTVLISEKFLGLTIRDQYQAMSLYYLIFAIAIIFGWLMSIYFKFGRTPPAKPNPVEENPMNELCDTEA